MSSYDRVRDEYIEQIRAPFCSIYQVGAVGAPGISDLDLFVVLGNGQKARFSDFGVHALNKDQRYILMHEPWVVNEQIFKNLHKIFPFFDIKHVSGHKLDNDIPPMSSASDIDAFIFHMEYILTKMPRSLIDLLHSGQTISARNTLVLINSLKHSVELFRLAGGEVPGRWDRYFERFEQFRKSVPGESDHSLLLLRKYLYQAIFISFGLIRLTIDLLPKYSERRHPLEQGMLNGFFSARLVANWTLSEALEYALCRYRYGGRWLVLPVEFACFWSFVASYESTIGNFMARNLTAKVRVQFYNEDVIKRHLDVLDEYIEFCRNELGYRGSIWLTLGAGDSSFVRIGRYIKIQLTRFRRTCQQFGLEL